MFANYLQDLLSVSFLIPQSPAYVFLKIVIQYEFPVVPTAVFRYLFGTEEFYRISFFTDSLQVFTKLVLLQNSDRMLLNNVFNIFLGILLQHQLCKHS